MGEKRCPKRPIATPTIRLPVAVDLGWASRDVIEGMIAESLRTLCTVRGFPVVASYVAWRADQVLYSSCTLDIDSNDVGSCIFVQDGALGGEAKYGRPFEN